MRTWARGWAPGGLVLLGVAGLVVAARRARLEPVLVQGNSMRPTLDPGQRIAVGPVRDTLRRGEVVLLRRAGREMVKRVVGLPGEHVRLADGRLEVDERHVPEPYAFGPPAREGAVELDVHLGDDELVVLGGQPPPLDRQPLLRSGARRRGGRHRALRLLATAPGAPSPGTHGPMAARVNRVRMRKF